MSPRPDAFLIYEFLPVLFFFPQLFFLFSNNNVLYHFLVRHNGFHHTNQVLFQVCISHGLEANVDLHPKVVQKPYVVELFEDGAIFKDLTKEEFDEILYCTGILC